jgi:hypothetical protein
MYQEIVKSWHRHTFCLVVTIASLPGAGSATNLAAVDTIHVSYPSPARFYMPVNVALRQGFFRERNLQVKSIVTRAEVDHAALISGDIDFTFPIGSTILSSARGLLVRTIFLTTLSPFWSLVVRPVIIRAQLQGLRLMRERRDRTVDARANFLKLDKDIADGAYQLTVGNFTKNGMLDDAALKPLVNDQLAGINPIDAPLSQMFDFSLLPQMLKEAR